MSVGTYFETVRYGSSGKITQNQKKNPKNVRKNRVFEANKIARLKNFGTFLPGQKGYSVAVLFLKF